MKSFLLILSIISILVISCIGISLKAKNIASEDSENIDNLNKNTRAAVLEDRRFASCNFFYSFNLI